MEYVHGNYQLLDFFCIELKPLSHKRPKGALCKNYTKDRSVWFKYPDVPERYGVLLEVNNLLVIDIDKPELISIDAFPPTFTVQTGSGGFHLYYKNRYNIQLDHSPKWGEIKTNGHVVGINVQHENGNYYQVFRNIGINVLKPADLSYTRVVTTQRRRGGVDTTKTMERDLEGKKAGYPNFDFSYSYMQFLLQRKTKILSVQTIDRSSKDYLIAKVLAEHGASVDSIKKALFKWGTSKVHSYGQPYLKLTSKAAISDAINNGHSFYKNMISVKGVNKNMVDVKENKIFAKINNGSSYYKICEKEMQKGNDNITWLSLEKGDIFTAEDGTVFYANKSSKFFTLPKNEELLKQLGQALLDYPTPLKEEKKKK